MSHVTMPMSVSVRDGPNVGDRLKLDWKDVRIKATVLTIMKAKRVKRSSGSIYTIQTDSGETIRTRLMHLNWKLATKQATKRPLAAEQDNTRLESIESQSAASTLSTTAKVGKKRKLGATPPNTCVSSDTMTTAAWRTIVLRPGVMGRMPSHRRILAPMVGGSELAFRLLCRR